MFVVNYQLQVQLVNSAHAHSADHVLFKTCGKSMPWQEHAAYLPIHDYFDLEVFLSLHHFSVIVIITQVTLAL